MADPLSLTASIIAVVGAAEGVGKTLTKVKDIHNAPTEFLALVNEVSDLRIVIGDIDSHFITMSNGEIPQLPEEQLQNLSTFLDGAKEKLLELDKLVYYRLVKVGSTANSKVSRHKWARAKGKVEKFQQSLRDVRLNIMAQMAVINSSHQYRIGLTISQIYATSNQMRETQLHANGHTTQMFNEHSSLLNSILSSQSELRGLIQQSSSLMVHGQTPGGNQPIAHSGQQASYSAVGIRALVHKHSSTRALCTIRCQCACHHVRNIKTSRVFRNMLGQLFVGYSGYPLSLKAFQSHADANCQACRVFQAFVTVDYLFPSWSLARAVSMSLMKTYFSDIQASLKTRRLVSAGADVMVFSRNNDVDGLKSLFAKRLASPNDSEVNTGQTALYMALEGGHLEATRLLLDAEADPDIEFSYPQCSSHHFAWNQILQKRVPHTIEESLRSLFPVNDDYYEERQFSKIHKIILQISGQNLAEAIAADRINIDSVDCDDLTPLGWAAVRDDVTAVKLLLRANASPNVHDKDGRSPLIHAAKSSSRSIKLLLEAGANVHHKTHSHWNALHLAAFFQKSREPIEFLIAAGVDLHQRNSWGGTPLIYANSLATEVLLDHGADINASDCEGYSVLHQAMHVYKDDGKLQVLLSRGASYTSFDSLGRSILHTAARRGDLRTLDILRGAALKSINPDATDLEKRTALQIAQERVTKEEGFVERLQLLLDEIRTRNSIGDDPWIESVESDEDFVDAPEEEPSITTLLVSERLSWLRHLTALAYTLLDQIRKPWHSSLQLRLTRSTFSSVLLYLLLGLGWVAFIYTRIWPNSAARAPTAAAEL